MRLEQGDMLALPYGAEFDAVVCVLGIFFVEDMAAAARALWAHVKPGGRLSVTTLGIHVWTPMIDRFVQQAARARPDIELVLPWRRTEDPEVLERTLRQGGVLPVSVSSEATNVPFTPEDWWAIVMGSGLRRVAMDLGEAAQKVREDNERWARAQGLTSVRVDGNYATAVKPR